MGYLCNFYRYVDWFPHYELGLLNTLPLIEYHMIYASPVMSYEHESCVSQYVKIRLLEPHMI